MAVTPVGNPYVESSDLVANYPGASEALAERIDIVGVNPFADAAARATAISSPTEGMMSSLNDTDAVQRYDGATWKPVGGKVLQVVSTTKTNKYTTSSTSFVAVSDFNVVITPSNTTSKILVMCQLAVGGASGAPSGFWKMTRGGTDIYVGDAAGSRIRAVFGNYFNANLQDMIFSHSIVYLDSPASISALTYQIEAKTNAGTISLNAPANDFDGTTYIRGASSITVMEIGA